MRRLRSRRMGRLPLLVLLTLVAAVGAALIGAPSADPARAESPAAQFVPADSPLIPEGVGAGESFRLVFVSSATRDASSSEIADYNSHAQLAAAGNSDLSGFSAQFRALISTSSVDARDNTATTGTGVAVYWLGGEKVADDYADLYDGDWDSVSGKTESGTDYTGLVWTGGNKAGQRSGERYAGAAEVRLGDLGDATLALSSPTARASGGSYPIYALSPLITVAEPGPNLGEFGRNGLEPANQQRAASNSPPLFGLVPGTVSVNEDAAIGDSVGAPFTALDADGDALTYSLSGSDDFTIGASSGQISVAGALDYETQSSYALTVSVSDGKDASGEADPSVDGSVDLTVQLVRVAEPEQTAPGARLGPIEADQLTEEESKWPTSTIWSATLTADRDSSFYGCDNEKSSQDSCSDWRVLTDSAFSYRGTTYTVRRISRAPNSSYFTIWFDDGKSDSHNGARIQNALTRLTLNVDGTPFRISKAEPETGGPLNWPDYHPSPEWTDGRVVTLSLTQPDRSKSTSTSTETVWVTSVEYASSPPNGVEYRRGDTIAVAVNFSGPVTAVNDRLWIYLNLNGDGDAISQANLTAGSGTNRLIFTETVADGDLDTDGFTVPDQKINIGGVQWAAAGSVFYPPAHWRHYEHVNFAFRREGTSLVDHTGQGNQKVNGSEARVRCNADGSHCLVSRYWSMLPDRVPVGRSFRLVFVTSGTTTATSTDVSAYNTFVQNQVAGIDAWTALKPHLRAVVNASAGDNLRTNTRTRLDGKSQAGDLGAWSPVFWAGGQRIANNLADFYSGNWYSSREGGRISGPRGQIIPTSSNNPLTWRIWTGSRSDGSPYSGYLAGHTNALYGLPLSRGDELSSGNAASSSNGYRIYAITPLLTVVWEPKNR